MRGFFFPPTCFHSFCILALPPSDPNVTKTYSHQNKIKPVGPIFALFCEVYKPEQYLFCCLLTFSLAHPTPGLRPGAFLTATLLFEFALQETTNSAALSRNICLKFVFGDFSLMPRHLARPRPLVRACRGLCFLTNHQQAATRYPSSPYQPLCHPPWWSADRASGLREQSLRGQVTQCGLTLCVCNVYKAGWHWKGGGWRSPGRKRKFGDAVTLS